MHRHPRRPATRRTRTSSEHVEIRLLGHFEVTVDGTTTPSRCWTRRNSAALVKVLALAPGHRLHREQVMDLLWPDDAPEVAAPKLHKAAHFVRRATGRNDAVALRNDVVALFPASEVTVDVEEFDHLSRRAVADGDPALARVAIERYTGELLPDDRYEEWAGDRRELLRLRHVSLLRLAGQWLAVAEHDPSDEEAQVALMRDHVAHGDCEAALLRYGQLERAGGAGSAASQLRDHIKADVGLICGDGPLRSVGGSTAPPRPPQSCVDDLVAELAELSRRQAQLIELLASAQTCEPLALGAAS